MRRKVLIVSIILAFIFVFLIQTNVFATNHTLEEIAEAFNNSNTINSYKDFGFELSAVADENSLPVTITTSQGSSTITYELEGSILSYEHLVDSNLTTAYFLADSIGQVNGYEDGELLKNFNMFTDEIKNYTVENEGFEIKENGSYYSVKMDINKKVPLIDESEFYLKPSDFDMIQEFVKEGTNGNQNGKKAKLAYDLTLNEDENQIYIGEENEITESTYKSILSALEVMYGNEMVNYFKAKYPELQDGIAMYDGFTVDVDTDIDLEEHPIYTGTKVVLVTLDNEYIKSEVKRKEYRGETINRGDKTVTLDFTKNEVYKLGFFDDVSSSDAGFLYKYILEPMLIESGAELDDNTAYFNIVNGKVVVGDKDNSAFKLVVKEDSIELLATKPNNSKTTITAKYESVKAKEYEEGKSADHFRYGEYNVTVNIIYGIENNETNNPKTGDDIILYVAMAIVSMIMISGLAIINKRK